MTASTLPARNGVAPHTDGAIAPAHGIHPGEPFTPERTAEIVDQFYREGYAYLGPVLAPDEVALLRGLVLQRFDDLKDCNNDEADSRRDISLMRMFEFNLAFRDIMIREPLVSLAEAILGADCHVISQNAMRNGPGEGVTAWHVDDRVYFPLPEEMPRYDARMRVPCLIANFLLPLTDTPSVEYGPTQVVPRSHFSGRHPMGEEPHFEDHGPISLYAKAGDCYIFHNQVWHRGAPNTSDRVRVMSGVAYGQRFVAQRFYPFMNYHMSERVTAGASPRLMRLLGFAARGAYG